MFYINDDFYDQAYAASQYKTFSSLGLTSESRIAVSLEDSAQWLTLCLYLKAIGASVMPLHPSLPKDSALKLAKNAGCEKLFYQSLDQVEDISLSDVSPSNQTPQTGVLIQMSSGTTGDPKVIDRSWTSIDIEIESYLSVFTLPNTMTPLVACPVTHSYGLICGVLVALARGKTPKVITNINPKYLVNCILATEKPLLYTSPTMLKGVLRLLPEGQKLHGAMSSGTILPKHTFEEFAPHIEHFFQQYGCSEAGCISINQNMTSAIEVGTPLPHLKLIAGSNSDNPAEVVVTTETGQQVHTNDLGYLTKEEGGQAKDEQTMLSFVSRLDDTIIVAGLNVYPQEVEDLILANPNLQDAVVFKLEDEYAGQRVGLQFTADQPINLTELRSWCQQHLAHFQVPYYLEQTDQIERLPNGKVNRKQIARNCQFASVATATETSESRSSVDLTNVDLTNKADVIDAIHQVLTERMKIPHISAFSENARLNQDLYLDSVLVLELILNLETELGVSIPDQAITKEDFETVSGLADFLMNKESGDSSDELTSSEEQEEFEDTPVFEDIKVHCFVSCICDIIKPDQRVDHRPFYFGVWDAEVVINDQHQLDYHSQNINHDNFRHWFKRLYSVDITPWYNHQHSKQENLEKLILLLENKPSHQRVMVMIDMYRLPERENKFNANPFPHYVMLETTDDPDVWMMLDPDFRWEGELPKDRILHAIESPAVAGGYVFDSNEIQPNNNTALRDYFIDSFYEHQNPMTDAVQHVVNHHQETEQFEQLPEALKQLPVLAIRKYAFEHGLAFFYLALGYDLEAGLDEFEDLCVVIEELVESYKLIQYRAMKLAQIAQQPELDDKQRNVKNQAILLEIKQLLEDQNNREFQVKKRLKTLFDQWSELVFNNPSDSVQSLKTAETSGEVA